MYCRSYVYLICTQIIPSTYNSKRYSWDWLFFRLFRNTEKCKCSFSPFSCNTCSHFHMYFGSIMKEERPNLIRRFKWFYTPVGAWRVLFYRREKSVFSVMMSDALVRLPLSFYIEKIVPKSRRGFWRNRIRWNVEGACKQEVPCREKDIFIITSSKLFLC